MRTVLSSQAFADLRGIGRFIACDNPDRALSFIDELRDVAARLAAMPQAFPLVPRYERQGIRRRSWKGYGILYSLESDRIFVHRIIGPGQDVDRALRLL